MNRRFTNELKKLKSLAVLFDKESEELKYKHLSSVSEINLPLDASLSAYQHLLLFMSAYPSSEKTEKRINAEKKRIVQTLRKSAGKLQKLDGSGLPFTVTRASFTHDLLLLLKNNPQLELNFYSSDEENIELNHLLSFTLPDIEKDHTSAGLPQDDLLETLGVKEKDKLNFVIDELCKLNHIPFIKDFLLDKFNLFIEIKPKSPDFSKLYNYLPSEKKYFHSEIIKKFDHNALVQLPLPSPSDLNENDLQKLISVMQNALALLERETDPCTFIDPKSLRYYELERGISVAIFGMIPERQMSMESYVGYTLFKNGYPCAYGGAWIYGTRSLFGINIFEQFRGGESGYILIQLLRVYKQVFGLNYFEVEPYQYGLDNPEGIESGAFWFYYRFGFRPLDKDLLKLSVQEAEKIKNKKGYRSSSKTLIRFTESNIGWKIEGETAVPVSDLRAKITAFISYEYNGNRKRAIQESVEYLAGKLNLPNYSDPAKIKTLQDLSLVVHALKINNTEMLSLIPQMISKKADDLYTYNEILKKFQTVLNTKLKK